MTIQELIEKLKLEKNPNKPFLGTITRFCGKQNITIFSENNDYRELYISEDNDVEPMTIGEAIHELTLTQNWDIDVILTYGNEDSDIFSTKGGVDFKFGGLFVDGKTALQQA